MFIPKQVPLRPEYSEQYEMALDRRAHVMSITAYTVSGVGWLLFVYSLGNPQRDDGHELGSHLFDVAAEENQRVWHEAEPLCG